MVANKAKAGNALWQKSNTPMQVKQAVTGYGKAVKKQVQDIVNITAVAVIDAYVEKIKKQK